jgi:hypothetical protein
MKYIFIILLLIQFPLLGQEFLFSDIYSEELSTNPHTSEVYFKNYFSVNDYYVANLRTMSLNPSKYNCLPLFSYNTNKMIYYDEIKFHLVDLDRGTDTSFNFSEQLGFDTQGNPFSPQGELAYLNNFIFSFKDTLLHPIAIDQPHYTAKWSSDTTLIVLEFSITSPYQPLFVEYSINNSKRDTIFTFIPPSSFKVSDWDYDIKRHKLYYSTWESVYPTGPVSKLWEYDRNSKSDSILYEYPKNVDPNCQVYYAGTAITELKWAWNYEKLAFILFYILDANSSDILTFWPDSNKITKVTSGCLNYGSKLHLYWANDDTLVYNDKTQYKLFGINASNITSIMDERKSVTPTEYLLNQNYPNPFNPSTIISYSLPSSSNIKLIVYNTLGQTVKILENSFKKAGNYSSNFIAADLPSGIYFYKLDAAQFSQVKKMILIK